MFRTPTVSRIVSLFACASLLGAAGVASAQTVVTTCGQVTSGPAVLNADLDCTGFDGTNLTMNGGTLTMNGHTITGGFIGVQCDRTCKIVGPGTITGASFGGIQAFGTGLKATQVDLIDNGQFGAQVWDAAVISGPATISGNGSTALRVGIKAKLTDLTIIGNLTAVAVGTGKQGSASLLRCTVTGNGSGVGAQRDIKVMDSTITDNDWVGVGAGGAGGTVGCEKKAGVTLKGSTVTGNGTVCGVDKICADVVTCDKRPRVKPGSTCGTSANLGGIDPGSDWDVCTLD
jgi:hypothetical protein